MTVSAPVNGQPTDIDGFRHEFHTVNGSAIYAVVGGTGPAVVLIHGWPFTWRAWRPVLAPLAAFGYTVVAPDLNGEQGLPQAPLLDGIQRVAVDVRSDIDPSAGHTFAADNPDWAAQRLHQFFSEKR